MNVDYRKEFINFLRTKSNHLLVLIVTIGAGVTKLFIDTNFNEWFWIGIVGMIISIISYILLAIIELKEIKKLEEIE